MGPLKGFRIIEMGGIGPAPFAAMLLADMGAEVIRVDRASSSQKSVFETTLRGRKSVAINIKSEQGKALLMQLVESADALIEGFRPGVMEKLGLGPEDCWQHNKKLVFARMTGWGQQGPLAHTAAHDINYIAITGALDAIGRKESGPVVPLNLVGDYGGGGTYLVMGLLAALLEAQKSGQGQVVDAAISDGVISLMAMAQGYRAMGMWQLERQDNLLDGGAPFYDTYQCRDGKWLSVGAIELHFYQQLIEKMDLLDKVGEVSYPAQFDKSRWPELKQIFAERIQQKTRDEWCELFHGTDACVAPVLDMDEAVEYAHNQQRQSFIDLDGVVQTAPAPRFSRTVSEVTHGPVAPGSDNEAVFLALGLSQNEIAALKEQQVIV